MLNAAKELIGLFEVMTGVLRERLRFRQQLKRLIETRGLQSFVASSKN